MEIKKRIAFISYPRLTKIISKFAPMEIKDVTVYEATMDEVLQVAKHLIEDNISDVIISAGGNGENLLNIIREIPVFIIKVTIADILEGIKYLSYQTDKIGILGYIGTIPDLSPYEQFINVNFVQDYYTSTNEVEEKFEKLVKQGCEGFIGTSLVCDNATNFGFPAYMVYSEGNVKQAFLEAFNYQRVLTFNKDREGRINAVLNYSENALLIIGSNRRIQAANTSAEIKFGLPRNKLMGSSVDDILDTHDFEAVLTNGKLVNEKPISIRGEFSRVSWIPIKVEEQLSGVLATFSHISEKDEILHKNKQTHVKNGLFASYHFTNIVGHSKLLQDSIESAKTYANTDLTVLILGETGTGKELFAQAIHNHSSRSSNPFVAINCSEIPKELLESELFGYEPGTFTGAKKEGKVGLIEKAETGTIFLDEIGDISLEGQVILLRVLQERKLRRLGGCKIIPINVRVITATNRPLQELVEKGVFRADLYYRLNVLNLNIPPLRHRREDIPDLIEHFIQVYGFEINNTMLNEIKTSFEYIEHRWPGNIREIENFFLKVTSHIMVEATEVNILTKKLLRLNDLGSIEKKEETINPGSNQSEKTMLVQALDQTRWNKTKAASLLGISRTTLWRKLQEQKLV